MGKKLSEDQVAFFEENGYLCPLDAFAGDELLHYQRCFAEFEAREGGRLAGDRRNKSHLFLAWLNELVRHPAILDAVEDLIGSDILAYHAQWFVKEPHSKGFVSFHQDSAYWNLSETTALSVWVAFEDANHDNGCMQVVPGSHKHLFEHVDIRDNDNMLWRGQTAMGDVDLAKAVDMPLGAGQFSIHHGRIVHGSSANHSDRRRVGYSIRYVPTHVERLGPRDSAMLVRGTDAYGHFDLEPAPRADYDPEALAVHAEMTRRFMDHYLTAPTEKALREASA